MKPVKDTTNEGKIRSALAEMVEMLSEPLEEHGHKTMLYLFVREKRD